MTASYENIVCSAAASRSMIHASGSERVEDVVPKTARELYRQFFETIIAAGDMDLRDAAFRLRYQVYCVENPFENPADNPDGLERDGFDARAVHCLLRHRRTNNWAGTVRLVLPNRGDPGRSFALQQVCHDSLIADPERFPVLQMAEVSRFCISKAFRQRQGDWIYPQSNEPGDRQDERRVIPNMTLGLIEGLVRMSLENGIFYWCAVMERPLLRLLARLGIHFEGIGPLVEYHGRRQPCFLELETMLTQVKAERPDVWEVLTDGGRHWNELAYVRAARSE